MSRITVTEQTKVIAWVLKNKDDVGSRSLTDNARRIKAETGVTVGAARLSEIEKEFGVERVRGGGQSSYRKDRILVIARNLVSVMNSLGIAVPTDLEDVCNAK